MRTRRTKIWLLMCSSLAIAGSLITGGIQGSLAQTTLPGLDIFSGIEPDYRLRYTLENNTPRNTRARYYLEVPGNKLEEPVIDLEIGYPEAFTNPPTGGSFDPNQIELREGRGRGGDVIPIDEVRWDPEEQILEIFPTDDIPPDTSFVIVMEGIRNPSRFGLHYFNLKARFQGDVLRQYLGTWELQVAAERASDD